MLAINIYNPLWNGLQIYENLKSDKIFYKKKSAVHLTAEKGPNN